MLMLLCSRPWRTCEGGAGGQINAAEAGGTVEESLLQQQLLTTILYMNPQLHRTD